MNDAWKLSLALDNDDMPELSPRCRAIANGEHRDVRPRPSRDDQILSGEIAALTARIARLEKKKSPKAITRRDFETLVETIGSVLGQTLQKEFAPILQRLDELEKRPELAYRGAWTEGCAYARGSFVSHQGSVWHSNEEHNASRPGISDAWTLAVKRGQRAPTGTRPPNGVDR